MSYSTPSDPAKGYMSRAIIAWFIFNAILIGTLAIVVWLLGGYQPVWFIQLPMIVAVISAEWVIMIETIAPVIKRWIVAGNEDKKG